MHLFPEDISIFVQEMVSEETMLIYEVKFTMYSGLDPMQC